MQEPAAKYPLWLRLMLGVIALYPLIAIAGVFTAGGDPHSIFFRPWLVFSANVVWVLCVLDAAFMKRTPRSKAPLWVGMLLFFHGLAIPFYWYFWILCTRREETGTSLPHALLPRH